MFVVDIQYHCFLGAVGTLCFLLQFLFLFFPDIFPPCDHRPIVE